MRRPRPRSLGDLDVVDVLIVEDDDEDVAVDEVRMVLRELALESVAWRATWPGEPERLAGSPATVEDDMPTSLARRVARRYRWQALAGAVLALAVAVTTAVVDARETAARAGALAAAPAVLAEATSPPAEAWRVPGRVVSDRDDLLLVVDGPSLRAIDPATGEATWTASGAVARAASSGTCFPVDESLMPDRAPVDDGAGPRGLVACVADPSAGSAGTSGASVGARIVVFHSATGRTTGTITADGELLVAEPVGRDLLVVAAGADDRVRVTRWDLATNTPRWDTVSLHAAQAGGVARPVERRADSVTVGTFAVDLASGDEIDAAAAGREPFPYVEHMLPGGARATWAWLPSGTSGRGRVSGGSTASYMLPGEPLRSPITDGSDDGVLLVQTPRGRLRGLDMRSGRMEWSQPYRDASALRALAVVDGVMLLDDGATVEALDVRTGEPIWRTRVEPAAMTGAALTDGKVVLLPVRADDGALHLVARRIDDGTELWRAEAPPQTVSMAVVDHRLVARTDDEVIGLV